MISCGIEINGKQAIFTFLMKEDNNIKNITGGLTKLAISDDENCKEIRSFFETVSNFFNEKNPDRIGIIQRNKSGPFSASTISFKIEGLIQLYQCKNARFIHPLTLKKFLKDKKPAINTKYKYQENSYLLALYLLET